MLARREDKTEGGTALIGTPSNWNEVAEALVVGFLKRGVGYLIIELITSSYNKIYVWCLLSSKEACFHLFNFLTKCLGIQPILLYYCIIK